jgi:ABC-type transport system involved in multi-copper enzyme maturation permease subunit
MMKALILKDIRIQIPTVVFAATYPFFLLGLLAVIGGAPFGARMILILSSVVMPYMVVMGSFKELRNKTENFILSLPILRKDIANGKFLLLGISTIIAAGICFLAIGIYAGLAGLPVGNMVGFRDLLPIASVVMVLSFLVPLYFRFGFNAMRMALVSVMILGVLLQLALVVTSELGNRSVFQIIDEIIRWRGEIGFIRWNLSIFVVGVIIFLVSFLASHRILACKDF